MRQFKVVKSRRGTDGKWFKYKASFTTASEAEARRYAGGVAAKLRDLGVAGTRVNVFTRGGTEVAEYRV